MGLQRTAKLMTSTDYKERFQAERTQVSLRLYGLRIMLGDWTYGQLDFEPKCPRELYERQEKAMQEYLDVLEERAQLEGIDL